MQIYFYIMPDTKTVKKKQKQNQHQQNTRDNYKEHNGKESLHSAGFKR